jgi:hypothetical protein
MEALAIVEVLGRRGEVIHRERLNRLPVVVGRGFDADLILDDPHVAASHLRIEAAGEKDFRLVDLGTKNGFNILGKSAPRTRRTEALVSAGATIRLGHTQLRIWHPSSPIPDEVPVKHRAGVLDVLGFIAWLIAGLGLSGLLSWVDASGPGSDGMVGKMTLYAAGAVAAWSGFWWLVSRTSQGNDSFVLHGTIASRMLFLFVGGIALINTLAFAFDFYPAWDFLLHDGFFWVILSHGIYSHLRLISRKPAWLLLAQSAVVVAVFVVPLEYTSQAADADKVGMLDLPWTLRPPWMRVADGVSPEEFFK